MLELNSTFFGRSYDVQRMILSLKTQTRFNVFGFVSCACEIDGIKMTLNSNHDDTISHTTCHLLETVALAIVLVTTKLSKKKNVCCQQFVCPCITRGPLEQHLTIHDDHMFVSFNSGIIKLKT